MVDNAMHFLKGNIALGNRQKNNVRGIIKKERKPAGVH
jgi:hypothetical protein